MSKIQNPIYLHVGYHKTGTTFLQQNVFRKSKGLVYLGQPMLNEELGSFFHELKAVNALEFDPSLFRDNFTTLIEDLATRDEQVRTKLIDGKPIVVSLESLHGGADWFGRETSVMAERLKSVFPKAKIILSFRRQPEYIESFYKEYIIHGGRLPFKYFLNSSHYYKYELRPKLRYDLVYGLYTGFFGSGNVHVYLLEQLASNPELMITNLFKYLSIPVDKYDLSRVYVGMSRSGIEILRQLNKFMVIDSAENIFNRGTRGAWSRRERFRRKLIKYIRRMDTYLPKSKYISKQERVEILSSFKGDNLNLEKELGYDLGQYKYY